MKRILLIGLIGILTVCLLCGSASAWSGSGTQADPWKISSQPDLARLSGSGYSSYVGNNKYFELSGNIQCSETFTPIGTSAYPFNGHFDGKGYEIKDLVIDTTNACGLFSYVSSGASFSNINFKNAQVIGTDGGCGILYGHCRFTTLKVIISNVNMYNSTVTATNHVGLIGGRASYGDSQVKIVSCNMTGCIVIGLRGNNVGSICGLASSTNSQMEIVSCHVKDCIVDAQIGHTAGLIGGCGANTNCQTIVDSCSVENCYVHAGMGHVGGIFGTCTVTNSTCIITNCSVLNSTIISDTEYAGCIYGSYRVDGKQPVVSGCTVTNSTIIGNSNTGGITGGFCAS